MKLMDRNANVRYFNGMSGGHYRVCQRMNNSSYLVAIECVFSFTTLLSVCLFLCSAL